MTTNPAPTVNTTPRTPYLLVAIAAPSKSSVIRRQLHIEASTHVVANDKGEDVPGRHRKTRGVRASRVSVARQLFVAPFTVALMGDDNDPGLHSRHAPRTPYLLVVVAAPSKSRSSWSMSMSVGDGMGKTVDGSTLL